MIISRSLLPPTHLAAARDSLKVGGIEYESADISFLPTVSVSVDGETAKSVFELIDALRTLMTSRMSTAILIFLKR